MERIKIAINGFGRIGRLFFRQAFNDPKLEIIAINDLGDLENLAYLLKHDSVYRTYERQVTSDKEKGELIVDGKRIKFLQEKDPTKLPWKDLNIDIVVESTGAFESFEKAKAHLDAGAKKVVITAPAKDAEGVAGGRTIFVGLNDDELKNIKLSTNASCTTNAAYPVIAIMSENPGIQKAVLNTVHAYTNLQTIVDSPVKGSDFQRGRAGAQNIVPFRTGAAVAITRVIKELEGKFDGVAMRVPIITGSIADITFLSKRKTSVEEINEIFKKAAKSPQWQGILAVSEEPIVSSDIVAEPYGAIVDLKFTKVIDGDLVKVLAWYDNEWGYCAMLLKHVLKAAETL
jgi:glyceraldehyde 3-phosphate dehydrogenase